MIEKILAEAKKGLKFFPCNPDKTPLTKNGYKDATDNLKQLMAWWIVYEDALPGMACELSGICVLDIDSKNYQETITELEKKYNFKLAETYVYETKNGGWHLLYKGILKSSVKKLHPNIDTKGIGGYVIRWDLTGSKIINNKEIVDIQEEILRIIGGNKAEFVSPTNTSTSISSTTQTINEGMRNNSLFVYGASLKNHGWSVEAIREHLMEYNELICNPPLPKEEVNAICNSIDKNVQQNGNFESLELESKTSKKEKEEKFRLQKDGKSGIVFNETNCILLVKKYFKEDINVDLWYDEFTNSIYINKKAGIDDEMKMEVHYYLEKYFKQKRKVITANKIVEYIERASKFNKRDTLKDYLLGVQWDGVKRIDNFFNAFMDSPKDEYHRVVANSLFMGAVARGLDPGSKVDHVVILESPQGFGKTTFWNTLAKHPGWCKPVKYRNIDRDALISMQGVWIGDFGEMTALNKLDADILKEFISKQTDTWTPKFSNLSIEKPRRCIYVGDTNKAMYLTDDTGNRRYLPITVNRRIDIETLKTIVDQLWAEAVVRYLIHQKTGQYSWWVETKQHNEEQDKRTFDKYEPLVEIIEEFYETYGKNPIRLPELIRYCQLKLGFDNKMFDISYALKKCGFIKVTINNSRVWVKKYDLHKYNVT